MGFLSNSDLKQFSCGDVIPGSSGMLTLGGIAVAVAPDGAGEVERRAAAQQDEPAADAEFRLRIELAKAALEILGFA